MRKVECFKIRIMELKDPFDVRSGKVIKEIKCGPFNRIREPITIVADPFLFVKNNTLYLFYENKRLYHKGVISMTCTDDLIHWTTPKTVLEEECHLSYPWIFEDDGHIYMIPETCSLNEVRIYESNDTLTSFELKKSILHDEYQENGFSFSDSSIYKNDNIYYLTTTINDKGTNVLELYMSDRLYGPYKKHNCSPIVMGNKYGRNAGCFVEIGDSVYRVAQDCETGYGNDVNLFKIEKLNKMEYQEKIYRKNLLLGKENFWKEGGHQYNIVMFNGKYLVGTDAKEYHLLLLNKILHRLGAYRYG